MESTRCRCCGKSMLPVDDYPIHTACIVRHWSRHSYGLNASRCREFNREAVGNIREGR